MRNHFRRIAFPVSLVVLMLCAAAPSYGSLTAPVPSAPTNGGTFDTLPVFAWTPVAGADHYQFQLAADSSFASISTDVTTQNAREALIAPLQNGTYYWHVRAINAADTAQSGWSATRSIVLTWADVATPQSPANGASLTYPQPLLLNWADVPYAQQYSLKIATDPGLSNLVTPNGQPLVTSATAYSPATRLATGTYYWGVTPLDAQNHPGTPSPVYHFTWSWPTTSTLTVTDLDASTQVFDPQFSWTAIPGAASYDIQVNRDASFSGSPAFTQTGVIGTSITPQTLLPAATYYWRVRAEDAHGNLGAWNVYQDPLNPGNAGTFTIAYDTGINAISNLTMLDYTTDSSNWSLGYSTPVPIVSWDPVSGASSYEVQVTLYTGGVCNWTQGSPDEWDDVTAATTWTPLGNSWNGNKPYSTNSSLSVSTDSSRFVPGDQYCVHVRALRSPDANTNMVYGSWTGLGNGNDEASFTFSGYPTGNACTAPCSTNYPGAGDYLGPIQGATSTSVPLFTWNPLAGKQSYFVIVATDPTFQHVIDYAFTQEPAYAPRTGTGLTTYPDSNTEYYWAVLPATGADGSSAAGDPTGPDEGGLNYPQNFFVHSDPPSLITPANNSTQTGQPTFQWSPVEGAYSYALTVNGPNGFSQTNNTAEASYTGNTTYLPGNTYTWSVHGVDRNGLPMAPSATGTFNEALLQVPTLPANPTTGDTIPVWQWNPVPGAIAYNIDVALPNGSHTDATIDSTAETALQITGTGIFAWKVQAVFPVQSGGTTTSAYTAVQQFTHTLHAPSATTATAAAHELVLSWTSKPGAKQYNVQVSSTTTFSGATTYSTNTAETHLAPDLSANAIFGNGGTLYWRVQAVDADGNTGAYSATQSFKLPLKLLVSSNGYFQKGTKKTVTITVKDAYGHVVSGATVKASGAGVVTTTKKTTSKGTAAFALTAKSMGTVTITASKSGCVAGTLKLTVLL